MSAVQSFFNYGFLQTEWVERVGWMLLHSLWQLTIVGALYALTSVMLRKRGAGVCYLSGCVALLTMIAFPFTWAAGDEGDKSVEVPPAIQIADSQMYISANPIQAYQPVVFQYELTPENKQRIKKALEPRPNTGEAVEMSDEKANSKTSWGSWGEGEVKITRLVTVKQGKILLYSQENDVTAETIDKLSVWRTTSDQWSNEVVTAKNISFSVDYWRYCKKISPEGEKYMGVTACTLGNNKAVPVVGADWEKAVTQAFPDWKIVDSGCYAQADIGSAKASRILLEKVRREYISPELMQQRASINAPPPDQGPGDPTATSIHILRLKHSTNVPVCQRTLAAS